MLSYIEEAMIRLEREAEKDSVAEVDQWALELYELADGMLDE